LTVIGQFLTLTTSFTTATVHCLYFVFL